MTWLRTALAGLSLLAVALSVAPSGNAQIYSCGDIEGVFRNPDLQPQQDGFVHASGQFFAQFQAIGPQADDIATFGFSFGPYTVDFDETACGQPVWFTGAYVLNYRADRDAKDGYFIPLKTSLVPDGTYAAAVHMYDAANTELARFWVKAIVNNCDGDPPASRCDGDIPQNTLHDTTAPWPMVLPGDGQALDGRIFTVEFAEELTSYKVTLNGTDITGEMVEWDGRVWDADLVPGYGPFGLGAIIAPECTLPEPIHQCIKYGPAYEWKGRALTGSDVIRVEATDLAGNLAVKDIHIGSSVAGGAITDQLPNLQITVDEVKKTTTPGNAVVFRFDITNSGGGTAHPFTSIDGPAGWELSFTPHKPVEPGQSDRQELTVRPPASAGPGEYQVNATISYPEGGSQRDNKYELKVVVEGVATLKSTGTDGVATGDAKDKGSPAPFILLPLAAALWAVRRRRQS